MSEAMTAERTRQPEAEAGAAGLALREFQEVFAGYKEGTEKELPLGSYAVLAFLWNAMVFGFYQAAKKAGRMPERIGWADLALLGVASHKLSRLLAKDWVTSPFRAPFTKYEGAEAAGEVTESARGHGMQRALGDLFT